MNSALLGVIIGGAIGLISGLAVAGLNIKYDGIKWRREHRIRYNMQRIEVYAAYIGDGEHIGRGELKDGDIDRMARFLHTHQKIRMLSSEPVREAAKVYLSAATTFFRLYTEQGYALPDNAPSTLFNAEVAFTDATRDELDAR